jgi:two-component system CheB/CheR fusion protein
VSARLQQMADRVTLRQYAPAGVVIDSNFDVLQFRGNTSFFLEHASGAASLNILQMARPSLVTDLRVLIRRALKRNQPVRKENAVVKCDGQVHTVNLDIIPLRLPVAEDKWLLVLFEEVKEAGERKEITRRKSSRDHMTGDVEELKRLRSELNATKESLQAIIEEQEATNEELKSANEEIESSNEELQSTNEELETAKEELQSTNEELTTLNEELSTRNLEMIQINNDLNNLLSSINLPIVMLDNDLTIRRATPMAREPFNIIQSDVGRRLTDLKSNLDIRDLDKLLREVLETLEVREREVRDQVGGWYSLRIQPYRTAESKIDGAVITLIDISSGKKSIARLEAASAYAEAIVETVPAPMLVLDGQLRLQKANRAFYEYFHVNPTATEHKLIYKIGKGQWDIPELRQLLEQILPKRSHFKNLKIEREFPEIGMRTLLLSARQLKSEGENLILLAMEDVTGGRVFSSERQLETQ